MAVHEAPVADPPAPPQLPKLGAANARDRLRGVLTALGLIVGGLVLIYVGLVSLGSTTATVKVPITLVGIALLYRGLVRATTTAFGEGFDTGLVLSAIWLVSLIVAAIVADLLPLGEHVDITKTIMDPISARPDLLSKHPLGTDKFSLDLLSRCIYAARISLLTATFAVSVSILIGGTIGVLAGYYRGWYDRVVGVITDSFLAFPGLILLISIAAVLGIPKSPGSAITKGGFALAIVGIPSMVRLSRANTMVFVQREFVLASRAMGARNVRTIVREVVPNVVLPVLSFAFVVIAVLIIAEGSLAFLGLGLQKPQPTWGNMIAEGDLATIRSYPHIPLVPGVFMFLTVFSFNRVGDYARSKWEPRKA